MVSKKPILPPLTKVVLPTLPSGPMARPPTIAELEAASRNPLDVNEGKYSPDGNIEHDLALDLATIGDEFAGIRDARRRQAEAIDMANDTEFWCAFYFQSRAQSEAFCEHFGLPSNKYIDGVDAAARMGVPIPPRTVPYKVGKIDKKLADLT